MKNIEVRTKEKAIENLRQGKCTDELVYTSVLAGMRVKHFKGNKYTIASIARHTERDEYLVIYIGQGSIYARPIKMFFSKVDKEKYPEVKQEYRFEEIN